MSESEKLRKKIKKVDALLDFHADLCNRKLSDEKELNDVLLKMDFARKQVLKLCMDGKKIIKDAENLAEKQVEKQAEKQAENRAEKQEKV